MPIPSTLLGGLTPDVFLRDYWQQKPLLVRGALPGFISPLTPEELAGLACEEDVTARLVLEQDGDYPWEVRFGPFEPDDFAARCGGSSTSCRASRRRAPDKRPGSCVAHWCSFCSGPTAITERAPAIWNGVRSCGISASNINFGAACFWA